MNTFVAAYRGLQQITERCKPKQVSVSSQDAWMVKKR